MGCGASLEGRDTQATPKTRLTELLKKGVPWVAKAVDALGPMLPFPGAEAAALVGALLGMAERTIANHDNLGGLRQRAVAYLDLLSSYHPVLIKVRVYKDVVGEYKEHLQGIVVYSEKYCSRNCIAKLFTGTGDQAHYEDLCAALTDLTERTMVALQADNLERVQDVQVMMGEALGYLRETAKYSDASVKVQKAVEEAGGLDEVIASPWLMKDVMSQMDINSQVSIAMVTSILNTQAEKGPHRHIRQPDLQVFWKDTFEGEAEVPWWMFFERFPDTLQLPGPDGSTSKSHPQLRTLLRSEDSRQAFKNVIEREKNNKVSVYELHVAFSEEQDLVDQVKRILKTASVPAKPESQGAKPRAKHHNMRGRAARYYSDDDDDDDGSRKYVASGQNMLPPLDDAHAGRDEESKELADHLLDRGHVVLVAAGGMGKSSLAAQAGWQLYGRGLPGGALWVDLRDAGSATDVEARFCAALGIQREDKDNVGRITAKLRRVVARESSNDLIGACNLLVVVDNADDALRELEGAETLRGILKALVGSGMHGIRVLVTSRVSLGLSKRLPYKEWPVQPLSEQAAAQVVRGAAKDLSEAQAGEVAAACNRVPLYLRLVSEALVAGRLTLADIAGLSRTSPQSPGRDGGSPTPDISSGPLLLVLGGLRPAHKRAMQQLAVFPSSFDKEGAAALLKTSPEQAQALLSVLYANSLLLHGGRGGLDCMVHMAVRQALLGGGAHADTELQAAAQVRYCLHVLRLLGQWTDMYCSKEYSLSLAMARDRQADIAAVADLLAAVKPGDEGPGSDGGGGSSGRLFAAIQEASKSDKDIKLSLSFKACALLEALGRLLTFEAGWQALAAAAEGAGDTALHAGMLSLQARVLLQRGLYIEGQKRAQEACDLLSSQRPAAPTPLASDGSGLVLVLGSSDSSAPEAAAAPHSEHPDVEAAALNNLALCLRKQQNGMAGAEPLLRRALAIRKRVYGDEHLDSVGIMLNLASCLKALGRVHEAEPLYRQVLQLRRTALSDSHPDTAVALNSLANTLMALGGSPGEALGLYRTAFKVQKEVLGEEHALTMAIRCNMASCLSAQGDYAEAEGEARAALEAQRRVLGEQHPDTVTSMNTLATILQLQYKHDEAETLLRKALEAWKKDGGEELKEEVLGSILTVAGCISSGGRHGDAEPLYKQVLEARTRSLGPEHADTLSARACLADCLAQQKRHVEAQGLFEEVLEVQRRLLGPDAAATLSSQHSVALCMQARGMLAEAEAQLRAVMDARMRVVGVDHGDTCAAMEDLAKVLMQQGRFAEALPIHELAKSMGGLGADPTAGKGKAGQGSGASTLSEKEPERGLGGSNGLRLQVRNPVVGVGARASGHAI